MPVNSALALAPVPSSITPVPTTLVAAVVGAPSMVADRQIGRAGLVSVSVRAESGEQLCRRQARRKGRMGFIRMMVLGTNYTDYTEGVMILGNCRFPLG